jgi:hypothetical protein
MAQKAECLNPNTGGKIHIDKATYDLFSEAICHSLKPGQELTYTQLVEGVRAFFKEQNTKFDGSVSWYAVVVKNDMEVRGVIEVFTCKQKKLHRLKK